jgi:C4-dicarboxylate-specific signal transduction histidine kinase
MGLAISGMHYTAMWGTIFTAQGPLHQAQGNANLDQTTLALAVAGITFVILAFASIVSLLERKRAEEALRRARADLAHITRVTTMGELTASLAHEVTQPIAAAATNANACLRWLTGDHPNSVDVNEIIREMIALLRSEVTRHSISVRAELAADLPRVMGDRVQLQQVIMNLITNSIDAMKDVDGPRELAIKSQRAEHEQLMVCVSDTGVGLPPQQADQIFRAFFTTKPHGTGMGLSISRSIVESHNGRLWAADNSSRGASFHITLPTKVEARE